ncbi:hypothetical protein ACFGVR_14315 [Mucilaginibacter sp. AW1-3]
MKKILFLLAMVALTAGAFAQTVVKDKAKVKKTTTVGQKFHNVFSKHKHYSGTKTKHVVMKEKSAVVKPS